MTDKIKTPLEVIDEYGVSVTSYIKAVQALREMPFAKSDYESGYNRIIGTETFIIFETDYEAKFHFLYAVQETIRASYSADVLDMAEIASEVERLIEKLRIKHPTLFKTYENVDEFGSPKLDAIGKPKRKKGAKKELAKSVYNQHIRDKGLTRKEAIAIIMEKVGMSQQGASTYYHNLKSGKY